MSNPDKNYDIGGPLNREIAVAGCRVDEVTICCVHSEDCTYLSDAAMERDVYISWDDVWFYIHIVIKEERKALTLVPLDEITRVRILELEEVSEDSLASDSMKLN